MVWGKGEIKEEIDEWGNWEYKTDKNNLSLLTIHPYSLYPYVVLPVLPTFPIEKCYVVSFQLKRDQHIADLKTNLHILTTLFQIKFEHTLSFLSMPT